MSSLAGGAAELSQRSSSRRAAGGQPDPAGSLSRAFPAADSIFTKIAEDAIDSPLRRKLFLRALRLLGIVRSAESRRRQMMALAEQGMDPFDLRSIPIGPFVTILPETSFSILLERSNDPIAERAAKLLHAALQYRQLTLGEALSEEAAAHDMRRHLFGRVANLRKIGLRLTRSVKECSNSAHVVVAVNGAYYRLDVIDRNGSVFNPELLLHGIESILRAARQDSSPLKPYGLLTAHVSRPAAENFLAAKLDESIRTIDDSILLLAIDDLKDPKNESEAAQDLHIRNYHNRDYRKALQLVVMRNGFSGAVFNHFAGIEGVTATQFASWLASYANGMPQIAATGDIGQEQVKLEFASIDFGKLPIAKLEAGILRCVTNFSPFERIDALGKDAIKRLNASPDAFFHAAAHLAYYEKFGRIPFVHNFSDMRGVKFGFITRYLSTNPELVAFLQSQTRPALLRAFEAHKRLIREVKSGDNPIHHVIFYLFASVNLKAVIAGMLFTCFIPDFFKRYLSPDIWASNIPGLPGIHCVGRFGTLFSPARNGCLAGQYLLFPDHIKVCFVTRNRKTLESWRFDQALSSAMMKLKRILASDEDADARAVFPHPGARPPAGSD
ncbi:MAG TPA: choline/carnitine O-acyltransferase [Xanthobacteraceae bacterium]